MDCSKKILFSQSVSSASIKRVCRAIAKIPPIRRCLVGEGLQTLPHRNAGALKLDHANEIRKPCARPLTASLKSRARVAATRQIASDNPETRDSNRAPLQARVASAKSCRANARDAAMPHLPAIRRAPFRDHSDTWRRLSTGETAVILLRLRKIVRRA